jgi:hypothetical protein
MRGVIGKPAVFPPAACVPGILILNPYNIVLGIGKLRSSGECIGECLAIDVYMPVFVNGFLFVTLLIECLVDNDLTGPAGWRGRSQARDFIFDAHPITLVENVSLFDSFPPVRFEFDFFPDGYPVSLIEYQAANDPDLILFLYHNASPYSLCNYFSHVGQVCALRMPLRGISAPSPQNPFSEMTRVALAYATAMSHFRRY